ncbi:MAG: hypothetical protein MUE82_11950 [Chloroflexi bacterium]|jgi:hypothetical protein|nr:hypothetical protein [Chloroflexota bacterium]
MAAYPISANDLTAATAGLQDTRAATATVTCGACGCRLERSTAGDGSAIWRHFAGTSGHDARGCSVACAAADHDGRGSAI